MASRNLTGPYRMRHLKLNAHTVATNKAPMGPYRGVARPGATFAIERLVDEVARELGREPFDLRRQNIVTAAELPYRTAAGMKLDTGDYVAALDIARDKIDLAGVRRRQAARRTRRPADRRRLCLLYRAKRARHRGIRQAQIPRHPRLRIRQRAHAAGRQRPHLRRRAEPRPGPRDHARADRRARARHRSRADFAALRRHRGRPLRLRHFRVALHRLCRRRGGQSLAQRSPKKSGASARICCRPMLPRPASQTAWSHGPSSKIGIAEIAFAANATAGPVAGRDGAAAGKHRHI